MAQGQPSILGIPEVFQTLTADISPVMDPDNVNGANPTGAVTSRVDWTWEVEEEPGSANFVPIIRVEGINGNGDPFELHGETLFLTQEENGRRVRVSGIFQDDDLVFETVRSEPVLIAPFVPDTITVLRSIFRVDRNRWRVDGTAAVVGPPNGPGNFVNIHLGPTIASPIFAVAQVDELGMWSFVETAPPPPPGVTQLRFTSQAGGVLEGVPIDFR